MHYIGIDPGVGGGFAVISEAGAPVDFWKMPETERDLLDKLEVFAPDLEEPLGPGHIIYRGPQAFALLERVSASPQMGVVSAFTFGKGYGRLLMALTAARIPFNEITPRAWQTQMQCLSGGDKNITKRRAQQLFPAQTITHAIADALLLAECCRRLARQGALGSTATPGRKDKATDGKEGRKRKDQTAGETRRLEELQRQEQIEYATDERARGRGSRKSRK